MIVVSLKRSYFNLLADMRRESEGMAWWRLEGITRGTWPKMSSELMEGYLDFVVGTYDNMIVTAYEIGSVEADGDAGITFAAPAKTKEFEDIFRSSTTSNASDNAAEWLVGCPMPGGPWKQGESRGTRRYSTETFLEDTPAWSNDDRRTSAGRWT
ncbi:hypothetical protein [Clavibacter zhangzhiyongii]|uniref:hypothetical protein n=1 Tax=Clavibacter zhangzhiyongii TaxID=2768071 RepID=UPI00195C4740|nr:hypothetical protein [Clavibacter zhangzhiyongii]MBM7025310.1 hypothetical protein [Clavibacter zhangzhiyongii]